MRYLPFVPSIPADATWHPFGHPYEVLYEGVRRLFGYEDRVVFEADHEGRCLVIEDYGITADYHSPDFVEVIDEQVAVITFGAAAAREAYLDGYVREHPWLRTRIDDARRGA